MVSDQRAPHKPILLLAVIELIEKGYITENKIILDKVLERKFKDLWERLIDDGSEDEPMFVAEGLELEVERKYPFKCNIANPFYYLQFDKFWHLHQSEQYQKRPSYSLAMLRKCFDYAELDEQLFELMQEDEARGEMRRHLEAMV